MPKASFKRTSRACERCRERRVKCDVDIKSPCSACLKSNSKCTISGIDKRSNKPKNEYINYLEKKLTKQNSILDEFKKNYTNLSKLLNENGDYEDMNETNYQSAESNTSKYPSPFSFKKYNSVPASIYGQSSIYDSVCIQKEQNEINDLLNLSKDPIILESVKLFFNWVYPDIHSFIFREVFLLDLFHPKKTSSYCSKELVYSICAVGSSLSDNKDISACAENYYTTSRKALLEKMNTPSICSTQAFILLGLFDIYNHRNNSGWMMLGNGLRMGVALGFHLSPESWNLKVDDVPNDLTISIRSRIFWSVYIVDHLISFLLGRPSYLKEGSSTIKETDDMPNIEWIPEYSFEGTLSPPLDIVGPLKSIVLLMSIADRMTEDMFTDGPLHKNDLQTKLNILKYYNKKILNWKHSLNNSLKWDNNSIEEKGKNPTLMTIIYVYYIVLLCVNRPFIRLKDVKHMENETYRSSILICMDSIKTLHICISSFVNKHGYKRCSILIIYSCIISLSIMLLSTKSSNTLDFNDPETFVYFSDFLILLKKCGETWDLSLKSYQTINHKLRVQYQYDFSKDMKESSFNSGTGEGIGNEFETGIASNSNALTVEVPFDVFDNSLGGPPLFMNAETMSFWETLFSEETI